MDANPSDTLPTTDPVVNPELKTAQEKITQLEAELATAQTSLQEATGKLTEIENAKSMAEIETLLADYELPPETLTAMTDLAKTNRDQAKALLTAMPKKKAPEVVAPVIPVVAKEAPKPMHNPGQPAEKTPAEKIAEADKLIAAIRKEGKFTTYETARDEARRRQPDLFN